MIESTYKWKINSSEYSYIVSEHDNRPFIYNADTQQRVYSDTEIISPVNDAEVKNNVPQTESGYETAYNNMLTLLLEKGRFVTLPSYDKFYNTGNSACVTVGEGVICPRIIFERVITLEPGEAAYSKLLRTERLPSGEYVMYYELGIPAGEQGIQGI